MNHLKLSIQLLGDLVSLSRIIKRHARPTKLNVQILLSLIAKTKRNTSTTQDAKIGGVVAKIPNEIDDGGKAVDRSSA